MTETLRSEIEISAPQATVFAFLTDPDKIMRWMGTEANVEARPGGIYLVSVGDKYIARGQFTEVIPVHRLAYSFGWEGREDMPPGSSLVEIDLEEKAGGTLVRFTHSGLPDEKERASHEKGWNHYLRRLAIAAAGGDPGPDTPIKE
ncbi:SRPBCC family protein [Allomesorhizobium camelthorni]|uniref:SRPBCC domain-containing protein n=1 Tax=Allomesorhizobium camelthorni TaxID=475069 RepID=A0A6G4WBY1_9HYPH|nr:SRPBCC family protein [Mesorhizobium camelthorni]NGO51713.1 SRPBCC domain-containing protein [Mesorhizobium camelthorni]